MVADISTNVLLWLLVLVPPGVIACCNISVSYTCARVIVFATGLWLGRRNSDEPSATYSELAWPCCSKLHLERNAPMHAAIR